jgi:hypothetical protein
MAISLPFGSGGAVTGAIARQMTSPDFRRRNPCSAREGRNVASRVLPLSL